MRVTPEERALKHFETDFTTKEVEQFKPSIEGTIKYQSLVLRYSIKDFICELIETVKGR